MIFTAPMIESLARRLWAGSIPEPNSGCFLWLGYANEKGYGFLNTSRLIGKPLLAHRAAWLVKHGEWPTLCVLHKCDVPCCVNPDHLWLGTRKENNQDMTAKGRHRDFGRTHCKRGHRFSYKSPTQNICNECRRIRGN